ncbi:MAG TPA: SusC/RagA family TonB-linked outer membrane protein [Puia sp.]|nr:SusC/RagA family TonB-linked outer membrane protein [Puia sp.]
MKLTAILLTAAFFQLHASGVSQTITFSGKAVPLEKVFVAIEKQTGFVVFFNYELIDHALPVTLSVKNVPLDRFLKDVLKGLPLDYFIKDKTIVISRKAAVVESTDRPIPYLDISPGAFPQITGTIAGPNKEPLSGASVRIRSSLTGTSTNASGYFALANVADKAVLLISSVGYQALEVPLSNFLRGAKNSLKEVKGDLKENGALYLDITLRLSADSMHDVEVSVNTGYQRIKPEQSTGAVSQISTKQYESRISTDFLSGLQNKLAGVLINNNVQFEGNSLFQIRGLSTINGNKTPLIVVDGYPTELSLDMIDPNEIQSVTVLKDAAAATVYGVRASNGVIVIERKKASVGKAKFTLRSTVGFTPKENYSRYRWDPNGAKTSIAYDRYAYQDVSPNLWARVISPTRGMYYGYLDAPALILAQQAAGVITKDTADAQLATLGSKDNTKDYSRLFLHTAVTQTYNMNFSGGNQSALYYFTANYTTNSLEKIKNDNNRILLSGRSTFNFTKRFSLELTTDYQEVRAKAVPIPDINTIYPYEQFQDAAGNPLPVYNGSYMTPYYNAIIKANGLKDNMYYPLVEMNEVSDKTHTVNNRITTNFKYVLGRGLDLTFGGIYENSNTEIKHLATENSAEVRQYINRYARPAATGYIFNIPEGGFLQVKTAHSSGYTIRTQLNYNKKLGEDHSLNAILGAEVREVTDETGSTAYLGYSDNTLIQQPVNYQDLLGGSYYNSTYASNNPSLSFSNLFNRGYALNRYVSGYSNLVYAFRRKYSVSGSIRIDQSNLFGVDPKYRYKPLWSLGAGWNIDKEKFMQNVYWIKSLKLRVADGFNGNVAKKALPQVIATADFNTYGYPSPSIPELNLYSYANSALRWEQTNSFNIGLDFSIFRGITGNIDYYNKKSTDLLATGQIDATRGGSSAMVNSASLNNKGVELNLQADWITTRRFNWNTGLVISRNTSKVLKSYNSVITSTSNSSRYVLGSYVSYLKGYPVGALFSYRWAGLDSVGYPLIYDASGKAKHMFTPDAGIKDVDYSGTSIPSVNFGLSNRIDVGNFYFYCMINFYGGFKVRVPTPNPSAVRPLKNAKDYWKQAGDEKITDVASLPAIASYDTYIGVTDKYTVNGDYFTLGDITASYNFRDNKMLKKAGFTSFELKMQASNVYTVGLNKYNYSMATGSYAKSYVTPTYTIALFTNF